MKVSYKGHNGHTVVPPQVLPLETPTIESKGDKDVSKQQGYPDSSVHIWLQRLIIMWDLVLEGGWQLHNDRGNVCGHDIEVVSQHGCAL